MANERSLLISFVLLFLFFSLFMYMWIVMPSSSVPTYHYDTMNGGDTCNKSVETKSPAVVSPSPFNTSFNTNYTRDSFTIIIPTFQRSIQLVQVLNHYCAISHVALILVVWNNVGQTLPEKFQLFKCQVPVKFLIMKENKLTNRFILFPEIQTEGIYAVDDDRMVDPKGMELGFNVWKAFPHLIVGFCERVHHSAEGLYKYGRSPGSRPSYSMILTNSVFIHRHYLTMFTHSLSRRLYNFIDKEMNGEDIIMNAMVADYLRNTSHHAQCPGVLVKGKTKEIHQKAEKPGGYSTLYGRETHTQIRSKCLNEVFKEYGYMPLIHCNLSISTY